MLPLATHFTVRSLLLDKPNKIGEYPIAIVVTIKGKRTYKRIGERIDPKHWSNGEVKRSHPHASVINEKIRKTISAIESDLRKKQIAGESISISNLKFKDRELIGYFRQYIDERRGVLKPSTLTVFENALSVLSEYDSSVTLHGIDAGWLRRYHQHLTEKKLANNTIHKHWKKLRTVFLSAQNERLVDGNPFRGYQNPKFIQTDRTYLEKEEVEVWEKVMHQPMDDDMLKSGYYFLLGCYSGLRVSDWIRFNPAFIRGDRLILRAKKNGKLISLQMHDKLREIVQVVLQLGSCPVEQVVNRSLKAIATQAGIDGKVVTCHVARHTFAVRCAELGISPEVTAELMGISKRTVMVYYKITDRRIDQEFAKFNQL